MTEPRHPPKTPSPERGGSEEQARPQERGNVQDELDEALADSFPASDPVSIVTSHHEEAWEKDEGQNERPDGGQDDDKGEEHRRRRSLAPQPGRGGARKG